MAGVGISTSICLYLLSLLLFSKTHFSLPIAYHDHQSNITTIYDEDIHDLLPKYGLPRGLVPANVKSYSLSPSGSFSVELSSPCYVHYDEVVYYAEKIKGKLSYGAVHDVSGIQAKKLFLWLPVSGIEVSKDDDGMIEFFVGALSEKLPAKQFEDIPACKSKVASFRSNLLDSMLG